MMRLMVCGKIGMGKEICQMRRSEPIYTHVHRDLLESVLCQYAFFDREVIYAKHTSS